ncbi:MAG TPA: gamma-glutamylcyclotransferase family protein [Gemmatimonadales bacterium]|nr:gamma-glutamylcyclotransferase family protein [Gemmatimonadales bacterium]
MKTAALFVYGTLRRARNGQRHPLLRGARFLQHASMIGALYDLGEYPGVSRRGRGRVFGELYELPVDTSPSMLKALDDYEGGEFERRRVVVTLSDGRHRAAWAYVLRKRPSRARLLSSGRYHAKRGAA